MDKTSICCNITQTPSEIARGERRKEAKEFAEHVIKECRQRGFTVAQFERVVEILDIERQLQVANATDITKLD